MPAVIDGAKIGNYLRKFRNSRMNWVRSHEAGLFNDL